MVLSGLNYFSSWDFFLIPNKYVLSCFRLYFSNIFLKGGFPKLNMLQTPQNLNQTESKDEVPHLAHTGA